MELEMQMNMNAEEKIVLSGALVPSSHGKVLPEFYRAILIRKPAGKYSPNGNGDVIAIEQPFEDRWGPTGGCWYAETLLDDPTDGISIDRGQRWHIESGMLAALDRYQTIRSTEQRSA